MTITLVFSLCGALIDLGCLSAISKVRLYSILMEDVRELKDFTVKHCRVVCFSGGGQYFAFANNAQVKALPLI